MGGEVEMKASQLRVDINTIVLQLKLRAVAKHSKALADELDEIDRSVCPECGERMDVNKVYVDGKLEYETKQCHECGVCVHEGQHENS
ncbi:hypothetical protein SAMN05192534_12441 [Alteribacillus persepolensis]|uniref:Uncharacterized protein n=1 Tax=Alteribacillus persepolensis TaxID=568899 RepID=A0A1G8IIJ9_9BACI|nr:hypothetical protein [Alteribacillus persepolensis]SDI18868.1 hypothetical protein SAMN05192534_12441 [Alteribacillus persepolensis]